MKIAVEGCAHGELEIIYDTIKSLEEKEKITVDLLICCGDFQATRNEEDLHCMAVPKKFCTMCSFYKYYTGEKEAPILTIFIGGNHEASNHLQELPYGGWVAPKIYYLGYAGIVNIAGVRVGGISGIYKGHDYLKGHYEKFPYDESTKRSVYHIRNLEVFRLQQVSQPVDIFLSHDWPTGICNYGNVEQLLKWKPFFRDDIESGKLGSKPCEDLLHQLQPLFWFSGHLHCKFAALVQHADEKTTKFLALDKCLPRRQFLQITDVPHDENLKIEISYDLEWLTILHLTNHLLCVKNSFTYMPGPNSNERWEFTPTEDEKANVSSKFANNLLVPLNFKKTVDGYNLDDSKRKHSIRQLSPIINPQTTLFCSKLTVEDPLALLNAYSDHSIAESENSTCVSANINDSVSSIDNSEVYETFVKDTPPRLSLNLPKPKFDQSICDDVLSEESFSENSNKIDKAINSRLIAVCEDPICSGDECASADQENAENSERTKMDVSSTSSPLPKKFKRRNASLYCNEET